MSSVSSFSIAEIQLLECTHAREEVKFLQKEKKGIKQGYDRSFTGLVYSAGQYVGHLPVSFVHL